MSTETQKVLHKVKDMSLADWARTEIEHAEAGFDYYGIGMGENIA